MQVDLLFSAFGLVQPKRGHRECLNIDFTELEPLEGTLGRLGQALLCESEGSAELVLHIPGIVWLRLRKKTAGLSGLVEVS